MRAVQYMQLAAGELVSMRMAMLAAQMTNLPRSLGAAHRFRACACRRRLPGDCRSLGVCQPCCGARGRGGGHRIVIYGLAGPAVRRARAGPLEAAPARGAVQLRRLCRRARGSAASMLGACGWGLM